MPGPNHERRKIMKKQVVTQLAKATIKRLAQHVRDGCGVKVVHGLDVHTICLCLDEVTAEIITLALNGIRKRTK